MRLFVGLDPPDALKEAVCELQFGLPGARWMDAEGLHLTLAFIGEVDGAALGRIVDALARVRASSLSVAMHGLGHFPHRGPLRVLWTGVSSTPELRSLAGGVRRSLAGAGFAAERRKFTPHVTIARFRHPPAPPALQAYLQTHALFRTPALPVASLRLYSSRLRPSGARYTVEAEFPFDDHCGMDFQVPSPSSRGVGVASVGPAEEARRPPSDGPDSRSGASLLHPED